MRTRTSPPPPSPQPLGPASEPPASAPVDAALPMAAVFRSFLMGRKRLSLRRLVRPTLTRGVGAAKVDEVNDFFCAKNAD